MVQNNFMVATLALLVYQTKIKAKLAHKVNIKSRSELIKSFKYVQIILIDLIRLCFIKYWICHDRGLFQLSVDG